MKTFVLIILFGSNTSLNGPAMVDGFANKQACETAGEEILTAFGDTFTNQSTRPLASSFRCVEISKQ